MIIGFKPQFEPKIQAGTKIHTIREDKTNRWRAGMTMHMATGVRTKNYRCFAMSLCKSVQKIRIQWSYSNQIGTYASVYIDDSYRASYFRFEYEDPWLEELAKNDGFDSVDDFFNWFNKDFEGKIIHWTDKHY